MTRRHPRQKLMVEQQLRREVDGPLLGELVGTATIALGGEENTGGRRMVEAGATTVTTWGAPGAKLLKVVGDSFVVKKVSPQHVCLEVRKNLAFYIYKYKFHAQSFLQEIFLYI